MKIKLFLFLSFLFSFFYVNAQDSEQKFSYSNITEFGLIATSPKGAAFEATTVNGFAINKRHHIGMGIGIGISGHNSYLNTGTAYTPIFLNYRHYFKPEHSFSPHVNIAVGGALAKDGEGVYSSITAGFRAGKFSFSSGLSLLALNRTEEGYWNGTFYTPEYSQWHYPFGITIKCGFSF